MRRCDAVNIQTPQTCDCDVFLARRFLFPHVQPPGVVCVNSEVTVAITANSLLLTKPICIGGQAEKNVIASKNSAPFLGRRGKRGVGVQGIARAECALHGVTIVASKSTIKCVADECHCVYAVAKIGLPEHGPPPASAAEICRSFGTCQACA